MNIVLWIIFTISLALGLVSGVNYLRVLSLIPQEMHKAIRYPGKVYWFIAAVVFALIYLKG